MGCLLTLFLGLCSFLSSRLSFSFLSFLTLSSGGMRAGRFFAWFNMGRLVLCLSFTFLTQSPVARGVLGLLVGASALLYCSRHHPFFSATTNRFMHCVAACVGLTSVANFVTGSSGDLLSLILWLAAIPLGTVVGLLLHFVRSRLATKALQVFRFLPISPACDPPTLIDAHGKTRWNQLNPTDTLDPPTHTCTHTHTHTHTHSLFLSLP